MDPKEFQKSLEPMMREQELQRRQVRNAVIENHVKLSQDVTPAERKQYRDLVLSFDSRGYWKSLWDALLGRKI